MKFIALAASCLSLIAAQTFIETLTANNFTSLLAAVQKADLVDAVAGLNNATVFVPTNAAFDAIKDVPLTKKQLKEVLLTHIVVAGGFKAGYLSNITLPSLNPKENLTFVVSGENVSVNGISVVQKDVMAFQGVAHVIEKVIIPSYLELNTPKKCVYGRSKVAKNGVTNGAKNGVKKELKKGAKKELKKGLKKAAKQKKETV